jgi:hypothetical protein
VLLVVQIGLLGYLVRVTHGQRRADARLAQLSDALSLLTEATESGFRSVASEMARISDAGQMAASKPVSVRRLATAAKRGRSTADIAAAEGLSEGEVALRLHLASHATERAHDSRRRTRTATENRDGALHAK